ncbi:hypothetical protein ACIO3O_36965 [Streptomyces sp. NPDC087440]|uniref:hypothetical protein n=1 Tax=Streptomyces sp. NPDC087440 TaxID=3365790 RepID=UPI00382D3621
MTADQPTALELLDEARERLRAASRAMLPLIGETVRAQFPDAAYLVLHRSVTDEALYLVDVRDSFGNILWDFPGLLEYAPFPAPVPEAVKAQWGAADARDPGVVLTLIRRVDDAIELPFLPRELMSDEEASMDRTPVGVALWTRGSGGEEGARP